MQYLEKSLHSSHEVDSGAVRALVPEHGGVHASWLDACMTQQTFPSWMLNRYLQELKGLGEGKAARERTWVLPSQKDDHDRSVLSNTSNQNNYHSTFMFTLYIWLQQQNFVHDLCIPINCVLLCSAAVTSPGRITELSFWRISTVLPGKNWDLFASCQEFCEGVKNTSKHQNLNQMATEFRTLNNAFTSE